LLLNPSCPHALQLVISYYMNAQTMCEYNKEEFTSGMLKLSCDSLAKLKKKLPDLRAELKSEDKFKDVYNYAYQFSREVGLAVGSGSETREEGGESVGENNLLAWPLLTSTHLPLSPSASSLRPTQKGQKCVQLDVALGMWRLLLAEQRHWPLIDEWCEFLQKHHANRAVSKDTWSQLYDFIKTIKPDFSNFDETAAWPYLLDEFVQHMKQKQSMSE
jgi:DCN1-like protein 1/2